MNSRKVAILSSGLDKRKDRGYENSSKNLFLNLKEDDIAVDLYKGSGKQASKQAEYVVRSFANMRWVKDLGNRIFNDTFVFEYIFFALFYIFYGWFNRRRYDVIYTQEPRVSKTLFQLRKLLIGNPRIVFGMGVKMTPEHYVGICDRAQVVNIEHYKKAIKMYPNKDKFYLIPNPGTESKSYDGNLSKNELREKYNIITENVAVCVGAINKGIKRMDYVVDEAIKFNKSWSLILVGNPQDESIIEKAKLELGDRFRHFFVSPDEIPELYYMADVSILASVVEGFPNVVLEATQNKIAPILHDRELNVWAIKDKELVVDMLKPDTLSSLINSKDEKWFSEKGNHCKSVYENNYSWEAMRKDYYNLLFE